MNKKIVFSVMLAFLLILNANVIAFAQTNDAYVSVLITHDNRSDNFRFFFNSNNFSLSLDRNLGSMNWHIPLALLSNHMDSNGYVFVQMQLNTLQGGMVVLFRRK